MKALDLFCGGGGAAIGLHQAGFDTIVGIDIEVHKNYPFDFIQADAMNPPLDIMDFDFVWASPPCQRFSVASKFHGNNWQKHPDHIPQVRDMLSAHSYTCIENVVGAPIRPDVVLTGRALGLPRIKRRRHFELSWFMLSPSVCDVDPHLWRQGEAMTVTKSMSSSSHFYNRKSVGLPGRPSKTEVKNAMGIPEHYEMTYHELGESVPPAYSRYIATEAIRQMKMEGK